MQIIKNVKRPQLVLSGLPENVYLIETLPDGRVSIASTHIGYKNIMFSGYSLTGLILSLKWAGIRVEKIYI